MVGKIRLGRASFLSSSDEEQKKGQISTDFSFSKESQMDFVLAVFPIHPIPVNQ